MTEMVDDHTATNSNTSFAMNALLAVPRYAQRAGSAFLAIPAMDNLMGNIFSGGSMIADATGSQTVNATVTNTSTPLVSQSTALVVETLGSAMSGADIGESTSFIQDLVDRARQLGSMGGILSYLTSRWALATFTAV